ncbi:MAG: UDP-N-acetylmuramoyl-tripeptide--D-alanyl-D-alanine ligase [Rhodocyclaceae bacterium]|nr:UDP-N-acetylmuramoyl-tripeptide--D-alanyl-D-alanine ligase [Rhodocyclaceae bacterium]MBX3670187.1 UDP-N-acetylmuramoyl-tripeptide--D-alanyl-D-alanine ligase [Rhodocyclaceae bacterium]
MMDLQRAALLTNAYSFTTATWFDSVGTDSRSIVPGQLFVALRGERFDGHDFASAALAAGASCVMLDARWEAAHGLPGPCLVVEDTRRALGLLARGWRQDFNFPLVAVAGSNGKTTVKEMIAAILRVQAIMDGHNPDQAVLSTRGNLNNDIGLPLTLLGMHAGQVRGVVELGMNHPGEIAWLGDIARPNVAVITNAQREHLEFMQSVAEVARENGGVYSALAPDGCAVINADDEFCGYWQGVAAGHPTLTFGIEREADVTANFIQDGLGFDVELDSPFGATGFELIVPGLHNVRNACAAAAAALAAGATLSAIGAALAGFRGVKGRQQIRDAHEGALLIDDTYNANPDSVRAAIDVLARTPGRTLLVLGDMGEVGERGAEFHAEVGGYAKSQGIDALFALGAASALAVHEFGDGAWHFKSHEDVAAAVEHELAPGVTVLVKGSRFMRMERVADRLAVDTAKGNGRAA